jgi:hypothetical protein
MGDNRPSMLLAEIHGKYLADAQGLEDYLTSSVFGHLRYVPPGSFWKGFLRRCRSLPHEGVELTFYDYLQQLTGSGIESYESLRAVFWPTHPKGQPDLLLVFTGLGLRSVVVCVEAKLSSGKSGVEERDQLARYLQACDSLAYMQPHVPADAVSVVVYLTTHDSRGELLDSLSVYGETTSVRSRLYRLEWQDVLSAVEESQSTEEGFPLQILRDVASFLTVRDLTHFSGMTEPSDCGVCDGRLFVLESALSTTTRWAVGVTVLRARAQRFRAEPSVQ